MVGVGLFDLEDQFAFYGAYHNNKVNVMTHVICVWPLLFGGLIMLAYTQPLAMQFPFMVSLPFHEYMSLNYCFVACVIYALFYVSLEYKSGSLAALLVLFCWIAANALAYHYPYTVGWKIAAIIEIVGWTAQFITHGFFEKRSPALVDNLVQACLLAPYFVMLEALHSVFRYEPYTGFHKNVQYLVNQKKAEFKAKKTKETKKSA
ncbi:hypothetical protein M758_5G172300 [Ceratodon purpureus]|nr:hypothetical protein M758_5G172300 [Ceratodon purpureus]